MGIDAEMVIAVPQSLPFTFVYRARAAFTELQPRLSAHHSGASTRVCWLDPGTSFSCEDAPIQWFEIQPPHGMKWLGYDCLSRYYSPPANYVKGVVSGALWLLHDYVLMAELLEQITGMPSVHYGNDTESGIKPWVPADRFAAMQEEELALRCQRCRDTIVKASPDRKRYEDFVRERIGAQQLPCPHGTEAPSEKP